MRKNVLILGLLVFLTPFFALAQDGGYTSQYWKTTRYELIGGIGTNVFMGDLGGGQGAGSGWFGIKDVDFASNRPVLQIGARVKALSWLSLKGGLTYARFVGDDKFSGDFSRKIRNLSFKSNFWEASAQLEFSVLRENRGKRYIFQRNSVWNNMNLYFFGGISGFLFNPKAELNGTTYELQPLGTSGQGIANPTTGEIEDPYKLSGLGIPMGIGFKYYVNRNWNIGFEAGYRYTFTDYIDDVSGRYFDNDLIRATYGDVAANLADRHNSGAGGIYLPYGGIDTGDHVPYPHSTFKANDRTDAFVFFIANVTYTFENKVRKAKYMKRPVSF